MKERIAAYERLAYCFLACPDEAFMSGMVEAGVADEAAPWFEPFKSFEGRIAEAGAEVALLKLSVDRTRLMRGLTPDGPTPPYQSMFAKGDRAGSIADISGLYHRAGFDIDQSVHDAPDQLGIELTFMAYLLRGCCEDEGRWLDMAQSFFRENLGPLALSFVEVMLKEARTDFFRGYALLLRGFVEDESKLLV